MATRSSSGRKKGDTSLRIKISTKNVKQVEKDEEELKSEEEEEEEEAEIIDSANSGSEGEEEEEEESEDEILPKKSRGRNCSFNRSAFSMPDEISKLMNRVLCCSCGKQLNPMNPGAVRRHPWLKVVCCKRCCKFLKSGAFTRDQDGVDEQCRWCGDGGRLYGCDYCHNCFCRACIKRNLGRSEAALMESEDDRKWKCYVCRPKKITNLVDDCTKILDYIENEERKERAREERAKQREKEKMEKAKAEREQKMKEKAAEKAEKKEKESTPQRTTRNSLPAAKSKEEKEQKKEKEGTPQRTTRANTEDDPVVIDDSPLKPVSSKGGIRPGTYTNPTPDQGVKGVQKMDNGIFAVTVGPRPAKPVVTYASNTVPIAPKSSISLLPNALKIQANPNTANLITQALTANQARVPPVNYVNSAGNNKRLVKTVAPLNDMKALKEVIHPYSIDHTVEKLTTVAQSLNLLLNSIKTDIAIAKLSQANMFQARNTACTSVRNGLEVFFNNIREVFNVQFSAAHPRVNAPEVKSNTSTPVADRVGIKQAKLDVSTIPICLDDSEQKDSSSEDGKKDDDSCMIVSDAEENKNNVVMEVDDGDGGKIKVEKVSEEPDDDRDSDIEEEEEVEEEEEKLVKEESRTKEEKDIKTEAESDVKVKAESSEKIKKESKDEKEGKKDVKKEGKKHVKKEGKKDLKVEKEVKNEKDDEKSKVTDKEENSTADKTCDSENTAAELELLKEMADEFNELNEKEKSPKKENAKTNKGKKSEKDSEEPKKGDGSKSVDQGNTSRRDTRSKRKGNDSKIDQNSLDDRSKDMDVDMQEKGSDIESEDAKTKKGSRKGRKTRSKDSDNELSDDECKTVKTDSKTKGKGDDSFSSKSTSSSSKMTRSKSSTEVSSSSESPNKKEDKKKGSKVSKQESKEEKSSDTENLEAERQLLELAEKEVTSGEESDDSDSDILDGDEPKRHRRKRKVKKGDTSKTSTTKRSSDDKKQSKSSKKASKKKDDDDSDFDDPDLEKEIKSLSKKTKHKSSKSDGKKSSKSSKKKEEEDPGSDSSNYDADLEKEIKALEKDTKLRSRRSCTKGQEAEERAKKGSKGGDKKGAKGKKGHVEDHSDDEEDEEEDNAVESEESEDDFDQEVVVKGRTTRGRRSGAGLQESEDKGDGKKKGKDKGKKGRSAKGKKKNILDDLSSDEDDAIEEPEDEEEDEEEDTDEVSPSQLKKLKANQKASLEDSDDNTDEFMEEEGICDSSDLEISFPKMKSPKKGKKEKEEEKPKRGKKKGKAKEEEEEEVLSEDSDFVSPKKKKKKKIKDDLLDAKVSDSDTDPGRKRKGKKGGKRKRKDESEEDPNSEDSDGNKKKKGKGKKRRRIKKVSSSDSEKEPGADDDVSDDEEMVEDGQGGYLKRRKIRKVQTNKKLKDATKAARKAEEERRKRIEERQKEYNSYVEVEGGESEGELPEGTERQIEDDPNSDAIAKILGSPKKVPVTTKCVLELDKDKKPLIEVDRTLVRKLKPHQVEACRFIYNCCIESLERMKKGEESGCILAHCMGLGKTLSVISFVHTMLRNVKLTKMSKCLVVCPLNTVLNWVNEFEIWLEDVDFEIEVFELSKVKANFERAQMLKDWHEGGAGVMILGYDMYRNLVQGSHCKNKKQKKIFYEALAEPGPDLVICDEGHVLKNDQTSLSKSISKIKTRKRVVLTGTPLQNNLGEYHCMVNFVKQSLLGTRKEFANRFVNPITNGQCSDSTPADVKLMKRRAHILHELLAGCVQRKDYSALTKFLPPKLEYVISVRLAKVQMDLYEKYLELSGMGNLGDIQGKGARLFKDYQALMRIWTHPWVLKLDEIRQENKRMYDDSEDSFIDDSTDGEDSFISGSSSSSSDDEDSESKGKKKKRKKRGSGSSSSDEDGKKNGENNENEVVKKWTSRRRGNEEGAGSSWMEDWGYAPEGPKEVSSEWWAEYVKEEDEAKLELSGKLMLLFQILKMCEDIGDKVLVFSQSLLSLDIIEDFLQKIDEASNGTAADGENKEGDEKKEDDDKDGKKKTDEEKDGKKEADKDGQKKPEVNGEVNGSEDKKEEKKDDPFAQYGKSWTKGADYFRMDGSTSSQHRKSAQDMFNDPENFRSRLFLISTKAGSLGINLVAANRVIIFDASWNPSHDIQSIFRVYRFGQVKPVYVYRFLAQGTMEEKIYERQVTKQSLSQRVVDEHQIERHFTSSDLQELYKFQPDRLDDPDRKERPLPMLPKDHMLAELMSSHKEWIVTFHEHDSLLENMVEQELSEEEKKAAWEDYENEKKGRPMMMMYQNPGGYNQQGLQTLMMHGQANLGQQAVLQIVQDLKSRFPNLPPEIFQQRVQAVLRQVLTQQIMQQTDMQRRQLDQQKLNELNRLNQLKQQIQQQQAMVNSQQQVLGMSGFSHLGGAYAMGGASGFSGYTVNQSVAMNQLKNLQARLQNPSTSQPQDNNKS